MSLLDELAWLVVFILAFSLNLDKSRALPQFNNIGYKDKIKESYQFDNYVQNHKQIKKGDIVVLRDKSSCLGISKVDSVDKEFGTKEFSRCPECNTTKIKERKVKLPRYRCNKGHEFDTPIKRNVDCTQYVAYYGKSFSQLSSQVSVESLRNACLSPAAQLSIREIDINSLKKIINLSKIESNELEFGHPYEEKITKPSTKERDPFEVDPDVVDRATFAHKNLQNRVVEWLDFNGISPRQPKSTEPQYDIGWEYNKKIFLCEVKSLTDQNEEKQLRFGLGQLLRYSYKLELTGANVVGLLMVERKPQDEEWIGLCKKLNILVLWPALLSEQSPQLIGREF